MASLWRAATALTEKPNDYDGVEFWSNPERTGWLTKQGEYIKTWRRRWFVLKQGKLFWFKESTITRGSRPRGVIPKICWGEELNSATSRFSHCPCPPNSLTTSKKGFRIGWLGLGSIAKDYPFAPPGNFIHERSTWKIRTLEKYH
ncbi:Pleckstrin homology domain - like 1 [Theobroma cacao]|nr:Pleckstrin homology domain - like 1 [Theobroma cacao]